MFRRCLSSWLTRGTPNREETAEAKRIQCLENARDRDQPLHMHLDNMMGCFHDVIIAAERLRFNPGLTRDEALLLDSELASLIIAAEAARKAVRS